MMPRRRNPQAGKKLRGELDALLALVSREKYAGEPALVWSEQEVQVIDRAAAAAERAEVLGWLWQQEMGGNTSAAILVKVVDLVSRVNPDVGEAKALVISVRRGRGGTVRRVRDGAIRITRAGRWPLS
jgi:hypothetical protein